MEQYCFLHDILLAALLRVLNARLACREIEHNARALDRMERHQLRYPNLSVVLTRSSSFGRYPVRLWAILGVRVPVPALTSLLC